MEGDEEYEMELGQNRENTEGNNIKNDYMGEKPYKCHICPKSFSTNVYLASHKKDAHPGKKPFKCDICQKSFSGKPILKVHMRVHTGEKPFKCDVCEKAFTRSSSLFRVRKIY